MNIADELRTWVGGSLRASMSLLTARDQLLAIADRIDAEYQKAEDKWKAENGEMWLKGYTECHVELMEGNEVIAPSLEEAGWAKLPKDAGDEYIHEHDKVDWRDHAGTWHKNVTVVAVCNDGCYVVDGTVFHVHKSDIRHHRPDTWERIIEDACKRAVDGYPEKTGHIAMEDLVARCKELAGDE